MAEVTSGDGLAVVILNREEMAALRQTLQRAEDGETLPPTLLELAEAIGVELWDDLETDRKAAR